MDLSKEGYENVRAFQVQSYDDGGVDFWPDESYIQQFQRREFEPGDVAEIFHENTKGDPVHDRQQSRSTQRLSEPGMHHVLANVDADYAGSELVELPSNVELDADLGTVLDGRRTVRQYADDSLSKRDLATLLRYGVGVSATRSDGAGNAKQFRTYPSAGGLYPVELYPVVLDVDGLDSGLYYYSASEHGLRRLRTDDPELADDFADALITSDRLNLASAPVVFVMTGAFPRNKAKYGPRGYRYVLQESAHAAQNLLLVAEALGLGTVPAAAFRDRALNDVLDVDGVNEAVVYTVGAGHPASEVSAP
ncbi:SagB/ThcOx family dehydrogenase [Halorussus sp. MSC15.2]|uniref:SagB/ThcOx family dehydrogenase n=1 Tax=Halorussus sp. MSC15.2 TaxID=2283638 RepID=UPI0013D5075C|nr:SagB/ThcOx family dehydrogenase [Halorussus sp. MSC15.2]NEU57124.1 SagB/ThcOx family dehydrogenase [Halorussus sp. MSC15.2]